MHKIAVMTLSLYSNNKSDYKCHRGIAIFFCPWRMFGVNLWRIIRMMKTKLMILGYFLLPLQVASHFRPSFPAKRQVNVVGVSTPCRKTTWMISRALFWRTFFPRQQCRSIPTPPANYSKSNHNALPKNSYTLKAIKAEYITFKNIQT